MQKTLWMLPVVAAGVAATRKAGTTHRSEDRAPTAYDMFEHKTDGGVRAVIRPGS
ncbi:hypothetical protein ACIRFH_03895 [Streptomyces sp. NPDC093586]|uniref:hypothetical protein n=1 Tax=Streptomyces sp. NPDC093586 TaxID=3366042 RepID=UPI0037FA74DE